MDWMVVKVVARERTEGAGDEKVLSPPRRNSTPPFAVRVVPVTEEAPCDGAVDLEVSFSVDMVGAMDRPPAVGGARMSSVIDERQEVPGARDVPLVLVLLALEAEYRPCSVGSLMPIRPDCGYGLLFLEDFDFGVVLALVRFELVFWPASPEDAVLKWASFFIKLENGRRRPDRAVVRLALTLQRGEQCSSGRGWCVGLTMRRLRRGLDHDGR